MLNINMEGSKAYAQHFQLSFHVFQSFLLNTKVSTHVLQSFFAQHKSSITQVLQCSPLNTNHQSLSSAPKLPAQHKTSRQSCASGSTPNTNKHIYISTIIDLRPIYKTNHHVHMHWGLRPNIKRKHQYNNHNQ